MSQYPGVGWVDGPDGGTPLDSTELGIMDQGIADEDVRNLASPASITLSARYGHDVRAWAPFTVYAAGQAILSPSGDVVTAKTAHTSGSTFSGTGTSGNWKLSSTFVAQVPPPSGLGAAVDTAAIRNLVSAAQAAGGGRLIYPAATYQLSASIPLVPGVKHVGVAPVQTQTNTTPGQYLADGVPTFTGGTILRGDGTFACFDDGAVDASVATTTTLGAQVSGVEVSGFACDTFTRAIKAGAKNTMGLVWSKIDQVYAINCSAWGFELINFVHLSIGYLGSYLCQGAGRFAMQMDHLVYMGGNSTIAELYGILPTDGRDSRLCRGWVFESLSGGGTGELGAMNEIEAGRIQFNSYNRPLLTETVTLTSASTSVAVADGTKYARGVLVKFATALGGFTPGPVYVVQSVSGNTIVLGSAKNSGTVTASASGTLSLSTYGYPLIEVTTGDATSKMNSIFLHHIDAEGNASAALYVESAQQGQMVLSATPNNVLQDIVVRTSSYTEILSKANTSIDYDTSSVASCIHNGTRRATVGRLPAGRYFDGTRSTAGIQVGTGQTNVTAPDLEAGFQGYVRPNSGLGETIRQRDTSITLSGSWVGTLVHNNASACTYTLPTISDTNPNTSVVGMTYTVVNVGAGAVTVATDGTQLFNLVAGKTSLTVAQGQQLKVTAVKDGNSSLFWLAGPIQTLS